MQSKKDYNTAKRTYETDIHVLDRFLKDSETGQVNIKWVMGKQNRLKDKMNEVHKSWQTLKGAWNIFMDECDNQQEKETEDKWFKDQAANKEDVIFRAEQITDNLGEMTKGWKDNPDQWKDLPSTSPSHDTHIMDKIQNTLSSVQVSKNDLQEFERNLSDQFVDSWQEDSQCKIFKGIERKYYKEFLKLFQEATKIDAPTMAAFRTVGLDSDGVQDQLKYFHCQGTDLNGKFGMYVVLARETHREV